MGIVIFGTADFVPGVSFVSFVFGLLTDLLRDCGNSVPLLFRVARLTHFDKL